MRFGCGLLGLLFVLSGCGSAGKPCAVTGTVKYGGVPVESGSLRLDPIDKTPGDIGKSLITKGEFKIPREAGMKAGKFQVQIYATRETEYMIEPAEKPAGQAVGPVRQTIQYIPSKYNTKTTMTVELKPDDNTRDFNLEVAAE
ncbi:MAG: hypothetical protein HZA46_25240 [Planctomycetales bacterium]|nr:hypothetical protein [Planctomycetales bacterium]